MLNLIYKLSLLITVHVKRYVDSRHMKLDPQSSMLSRIMAQVWSFKIQVSNFEELTNTFSQEMIHFLCT